MLQLNQIIELPTQCAKKFHLIQVHWRTIASKNFRTLDIKERVADPGLDQSILMCYNVPVKVQTLCGFFSILTEIELFFKELMHKK